MEATVGVLVTDRVGATLVMATAAPAVALASFSWPSMACTVTRSLTVSPPLPCTEVVKAHW